MTDAKSRQSDHPRRGPLAGLKVLEFAGIGPGPHCAMLLGNLGAEVLRVMRPGGNGFANPVVDNPVCTLTLDIRTDDAREKCLALAEKVDVVIEGNRPGVMERLGLGPDAMMARNPRLVYGRMTGWGQTGPLAQTAGHDLNYIALTGALAAIGRPGDPAQPPLNLVGDFGGGSLYLAFGIVAALWERERSGAGQVIDAAIIDGVASMMTFFSGLAAVGAISLDRERNLLGGAAPFYRCYTCADGKDISVGPLEPKFYEELIDRGGLGDEFKTMQYDQSNWRERTGLLAKLFAAKPRREWCALLEGTDACFAPVLTLDESFAHPHMKARGVYVERGGVTHAAPAPRFSRTPGEIPAPLTGEELLARWEQQDG